jgi:phosphoglycolate phosphatase
MTRPLRKYAHVIWDWNGTLLNDVWLCIEIVNAMLQTRERPRISQRQYVEMFDFPVKTYYQRVGFDFSRESFESLAAEFMREYDRRQHECSLCPGATTLLQYCRNHAITQSLLSASHQARLEHIVTVYQIRPFFHQVSGLTDVYAASKVANGQALLRQLNMSPNDVLLVGDTTHDVEVAQALGVDCVLLDGGHHSRRKLESTGMTVKDSLHELTE